MSRFKPPEDSTNLMLRLHTVEDVMRHWPFLLECMNGLNLKAKGNYTSEKFFFTLIKAIELKHLGLVALLLDSNSLPLGFGCAFAATDFQGEDCFYVWATYSNSKCPTCLSELLRACEDYARSIRFNLIKISTPRSSGAADRLFEGLGFLKEFQTYKKSI